MFYSQSPYSFLNNNGLRYIDPDGRAPLDHIFYFKNGKFERMVDTGVGNKIIFNINGQNMSLNSSLSSNQKYFQKVSEYYARELGFKGTVKRLPPTNRVK